MQQKILHTTDRIMCNYFTLFAHFKCFFFTVEVKHVSFSHVPITQIEKADILVKGKPTEFSESCVMYCIVYTTRPLVL
jgi:hypothetical protein